MSYNITVESGKTVRLPTAGRYCDRDILVTALGGGVDLPELAAPGAAADLMAGKQMLDGDGRVVDGSFSIAEEMTEQDSLIDQIKAALKGKTAGGGSEPVIEPLEVTENGTYTTPDNADGYSPVTVNVPIPDGYIQPSGTLQVTENGTHDVTEYASVNVNVPSKEPLLQEKTVTENGEVTADSGYDGLSKVVVNVELSGGDSDLPAGYRRVDYIQFAGKQIVDTGIICNKNTKIQTYFTRASSGQEYLYGVASSGNKASVTAYLGGSWRFGNKAATKSVGTVNAKVGYVAYVDASTISVSNNVVAISGVDDFETVGSLLIGSCRSASGAVGAGHFDGTISFFSMWEGDEQVLKLVPVTDGTVFRFYDMVSKAFFDSITDTPLEGGNL